jgi:hypothetical protein
VSGRRPTPEEAARLIVVACDSLKEMLLAKNAAYGNSILDPVRCFSGASPVEQLLVRLDDKVSRMVRGYDDGEDTERDACGYLLMLMVAERWDVAALPPTSSAPAPCPECETSKAALARLEGLAPRFQCAECGDTTVPVVVPVCPGCGETFTSPATHEAARAVALAPAKPSPPPMCESQSLPRRQTCPPVQTLECWEPTPTEPPAPPSPGAYCPCGAYLATPGPCAACAQPCHACGHRRADRDRSCRLCRPWGRRWGAVRGTPVAAVEPPAPALLFVTGESLRTGELPDGSVSESAIERAAQAWPAMVPAPVAEAGSHLRVMMGARGPVPPGGCETMTFTPVAEAGPGVFEPGPEDCGPCDGRGWVMLHGSPFSCDVCGGSGKGGAGG